MNRQFFAAAAAGSLLAGCTPISVSDVGSQYYQLPANTAVVVRQTITIPPGTSHVTLQDGRIVDHLRRYEPFCQFEVNDVLDSEQQVGPGRFSATRIIRQQKLYGAERQPVLLAANAVTGSENDAGIGKVLLADVSDGPSFFLNEVNFLLQSAEQPKVRELRCAGGWAFPSTVAYPTLADMNRVLGALISIEVN
jgi:hypothetical protein